MTQGPTEDPSQQPPEQADIVTDEVTAAKLGLLRTAYHPTPGQTPPLLSQHPLLAVGAVALAGALVGGVPIARKVVFVVAGFAGRNMVSQFLRKK